MPPAARVSDMHDCPVAGAVPHEGGPVLAGEATVLIGNRPAARNGDSLGCVGDTSDRIREGEATVLIGAKQAARVGDATEHGGHVTAGCPTVLIGKIRQAECMEEASKSGAALVQRTGGE